MLQTYLKDWRYLLASLFLFLLPFERIPSHDVKGITIRLTSILIVLFAITVAPQLFLKKELTPRSKIDWAILAFYFWGWVSVLYAANRHHAALVMLLWGFVLIGYLLVSRLWRQFFNPQAIKQLFVATGVITALFGLYQFVANTYFGASSTWTLLSPNYERSILGFARVQSVGVEPLYYGAFLFLPIAFLLVDMVRSKKMPRTGEALSLIIIIAAFVLTVSRGAYLGFIGAIIVLIIALAAKRALVAKQLAVTVVVLLLGFGLSQALVFATRYFNPATSPGGVKTEDQFVDHAIASQATANSSLNPRLEAMQDAFSIYKKHPILGVGIGNYGVVTTVQKTAQNQYPIVNNQYLETLTELGPVGALLFLVMLVFVMAKLITVALRKDEMSWYAVTLIFVALGIGVQWNFFSTIYILLIWVFIGLVDAIPESKQ